MGIAPKLKEHWRADFVVVTPGRLPVSATRNVGLADDFANLMAHHDQATLAHNYLEYREHWSPVFKD